MTSAPTDRTAEESGSLKQLQLQNLELERLNQVLRTAFDKVNAQRERYADMFNFSPVGYFTLDSLGMILEVNLAGAILLGIRRSEKSRQPFAASISTKDRPAFNRFIAQVLNGKGQKYCEVLLLASSHRPETTVLIKGVADESCRECRIVVVEINAEGAADELISKRSLLNATPSGVWLKDQHRHSMVVNWKLQDRLGYAYPQFLPGQSGSDFAAPALNENGLDKATGGPAESTATSSEPLIAMDGLDKWQTWLETGKASVMADAGLASVLNSRNVLDGAADAIFIADQMGHYQYVNQEASRLLGYSSEELLTMSIGDVTPVEDVAESLQLFEMLLKNRFMRSKLRLCCKSGQTVTVAISASLLPDGTCFGACRAIAERNPQELQLLGAGAESANSHPNPDQAHGRVAIPEPSLAGIVRIQSRKIVWSNKAFASMLGYTRKELTGQSTRLFYPSEQTYVDFGEVAYPVLQQGQIFRKEIRFQRKDGSLGCYDFSGELLDPVSDESIWSLVDISERKKSEMRATIRVVVADENQSDGGRIAEYLRKRPGVEVLGESVDHEVVIRMVGWLHPEVLVLDLSASGISGLDTLVSIKKDFPAVRVIVLSVHSSEELVLAVLRLGATGFMIKEEASRELDQALDTVINGDTWVSPAIVMSEVADCVGRITSGVTHNLLTPRQRQVLELIAAGLSTKDIGRQLELSVKTIETFRSQIMHRLHIHSVAGLVKYAIRHAFVRP